MILSKPIIVNPLYDPFFQCLRKVQNNNPTGFLIVAGGAARRFYETDAVLLENSDIDVFASSLDILKELIDLHHRYVNDDNPTFNVSEKPNLYQMMWEPGRKPRPPSILGNKIDIAAAEEPYINIQFIKSCLYNNLEELIEDFDFTICRFASDGLNVFYNEETELDHRKKVLQNRSKRNPTPKTVSRIKKYIKYGFTPRPSLLTWAFEDLKITSPERVTLDFFY